MNYTQVNENNRHAGLNICKPKHTFISKVTCLTKLESVEECRYITTTVRLYIYGVHIRDAGTILYGGPTNQNKLCDKSGGGTNT